MTTFTPPHPNPQTSGEVIANRLAAIKAGAVKFHGFTPIKHWTELVKND